MAETRLAAHFNREGFPVCDHHTYVIAGDGCLQEGVASEACSLAGTLRLSKLTLLYDANNIQIEGSTDLAFREDVAKRFQAYDWNVIDVPDGNSVPMISDALRKSRNSDRPTLIIVHTKIGFGCPKKQGSASAHGAPLGEDNLKEPRRTLGYEYPEDFFVPAEVYTEMDKVKSRGNHAEAAWKELMGKYREEYPELAVEWDAWHNAPDFFKVLDDDALFRFDAGSMATRSAGGQSLNRLFAILPNLFGGSADLAPSNNSDIKESPWYDRDNRDAVNIHFGVREHAMAGISNGIALHGGLHAYCATFFVFSDYMKGAMRLSALMKLPVTYILTHDSIGVGEDGPTHEPVEHLAALRALPDMTVIRPADAVETACAYLHAFRAKNPTAIVLTRQNLPVMDRDIAKNALKGGYILSDSKKKKPDVILIASGSEVNVALSAQRLLREQDIDARVVSMPSFELFDAQDEAYRDSVLPSNVRARVAVEALSSFGWHKYIGLDGACVCLDHFGESAPADYLFKKFGFTPEHVCEVAIGVAHKNRK